MPKGKGYNAGLHKPVNINQKHPQRHNKAGVSRGANVVDRKAREMSA